MRVSLQAKQQDRDIDHLRQTAETSQESQVIQTVSDGSDVGRNLIRTFLKQVGCKQSMT
jgi:hypothetical protein